MTINLGNIVTQGGKKVASGIASNLDVDAIVTSLVDARKIPVTDLEDEVKLNGEKVSALGEFRTIMESLRTASDFLRNKPGFDTASSNIFEYRASGLTINSSATVGNFATVSVSPGTSLGDYSLEINNIAKAYSTRSQSFVSQTDSVTEAASGTTAGRFSAGTVSIHSRKVAYSDNETLTNAEYSDFGTATGILTAGGYYNFNTTGSVDPNLKGQPTSISATSVGTNVQVEFAFGGYTYVATVAANAGGDGQSIANNSALNFRNAETGMGFSLLTTGGDFFIGEDLGNDILFAGALGDALANVYITQERELENFDSTAVTGTVLQGLDSEDVKLVSNNWDINDRSHGFMSEFTVNAVSVSGAGDASISVKINNETYTASGLGGGSNVINSNLTLTAASGRTLKINLGNAGISVDIADSTDAATLKTALDDAFQAQDADIVIESGDSLIDIAAAFNAKSAVSNVTASIVAVSASEYRLVLKSNDVGTDNQYQFTDSTGVLTNVTFSTLQAAEDAQIEIDGTAITRGTNNISDVIEGMTINVLEETAGDVITISVDKDIETAKAGIVNFINAYNELRVFQAKHLERDEDGNLSEDSKLGDSTVLRNTIRLLADELASAIGGVTNDDFSGLLNVGISFIDYEGDDETNAASNVLTYDDEILTAALTDNYDEVRQLFEYSFNPDSDKILLSERTNSTTLTAFRLDIDLTRTGDEIRVKNPTSGALLFEMDFEEIGSTGNYRLTGRTGTSLDGLVLLYTGDGTDIIDVEASQGYGDRFYNLIDDTLDEVDGTLADELSFINESNDDLDTEITDLEATIEEYRLQLLEQFSALEEAVSRVNTLLSFLDAQSQSINGSNN